MTAAKLEHEWSAETKLLALDIDDREALLRAMEDWCPPELRELLAVLLQEHVGRVRDGLVYRQRSEPPPVAGVPMCPPQALLAPGVRHQGLSKWWQM